MLFTCQFLFNARNEPAIKMQIQRKSNKQLYLVYFTLLSGQWIPNNSCWE